MKQLGSACLLFASLAIGCGSEVEVDSSGTTGAGGATASSSNTDGSGAVTSAASSTTGAGGIGVGGSAVGSTGAGGAPWCNDPTVFVDIQGPDLSQHLDASCMPVGFVITGGLGPPKPKTPAPAPLELEIRACPGPVLLIHARAIWPGSTMSAYVVYTNDQGMMEKTPQLSGALDVTTFGAEGGIIEGSFNAVVVDEASMTSFEISGKFRVCRVPDRID